MFDIWQEIFSTIRKNKLRTFLTGFSVAWGIFMLILLLASGNGLKNGVMSNFGNQAKNSITLYPGYTSMPYQGMPKNRRTKFDQSDVEYLQREYPNISNFSATIERYGTIISFGKEYGSNGLCGVLPAFAQIENVEVKAGNGRFINDADIRDFRKVMVMHRKTADILFRSDDPLGKYVIADKVAYQVIGIYEDENMNQSPSVYIPLSTIQRIYNPEEGYGDFRFTIEDLKSEKENDVFEQEIRQSMGMKHMFDAQDNRALFIWNRLKDYVQAMGIFNGINLFVWIIGIGTLIAGIVGVSNIMLITVKERTREFGIRKSLGATPLSILKLVIFEAIVITGFFGYVGMVAGIGLTELINYVMLQSAQGGGAQEMSVFKNPTVELPVVLTATLILILAGILAGYFPARKAVSIKPIEALKYE